MKIFALLRNDKVRSGPIVVYVVAKDGLEAKSYWPKNFPIEDSMITALDLSLALDKPGVLGAYDRIWY